MGRLKALTATLYICSLCIRKEQQGNVNVRCIYILSQRMPSPGEAALPSSFETLPVPLAAETQGAELTSKLKQTLTMAQTPSITCHALAFSVSDAYYFFLSDNSTFDGSLQAG